MLAVMDDAGVLAGDGHAAWSEWFNELFAQVAGCFGKAAVRRHGRAYLLGLLSHSERKNSWSLAEFAGDVSPDGMQRLLNFSPWDQDACRDALARYVVKGLGDPAAVLAVLEIRTALMILTPGGLPARQVPWEPEMGANVFSRLQTQYDAVRMFSEVGGS